MEIIKKDQFHGQGMPSDNPERIDSYQVKSPIDDTLRPRIAVIIPRILVKKIKDALEAHENLDKNVKIRPARPEEQRSYLGEASIEPQSDAFVIPTKVSVEVEQGDSHALSVKWDLLQTLGLAEFKVDVGIITPRNHEASASGTHSINPLARTIGHWLHQLPHEESEQSFARDAVSSYSWTYMIYPPLLLLPPTVLSNLSSIFASGGQSLPTDFSSLWPLLSREFKTSHIALNSPILARTSKEASVQGGGRPEANILRSPTGLAPIYGDFGSALPTDYVPTITDFSSAFWCTAQQNGIFQTWAPRYTMFSRGNISEKARILSLETLTERRLGSLPEETSAVDLYAGIGYFAFSYAKARVGKVLCWEINPWSVEGLRRGGERNRWGVEVIKDGRASTETINVEERLIVFQESNEHAARRIAAMKDSIPPVRHVNCGLLPSSSHSWEVAVQVLDPTGGWIHVHENIAKKDMEGRRDEIVGIFSRLVMNHCLHKPERQWRVECEHVEQVKSYAPGVMHYVLDIFVSPPG